MNGKVFGVILMVTGILLIVYAIFIMEVSVDGSIVNIDLLNTRQNFIILGSLAVMAGLLLRLFSPYSPSAIPDAENPSQTSRILNNIKSSPVEAIRIATFIITPFGIWILYKYLFSPENETNSTQLILGLLLCFAPITLNWSLAKSFGFLAIGGLLVVSFTLLAWLVPI